MRGARAAAALGLLLIAAGLCVDATHTEDLHWEGEAGETADEFLEVNQDAPGLGAHLRRIRDTLLGSIWDHSSDDGDLRAEEPKETREKRQVDTDDSEFATEDTNAWKGPQDTHNEIDKDDEDFANHLGSGDVSYPQSPNGKEMTMQVSFVVREPYRDSYSNRDSTPFQNLSYSLADAVNSLYDQVAGTQRATLVRIQSRPSDKFSCKVSLDLVTTNFYDVDRLRDILYNHIKRYQKLGDLVVSDEEFLVQRNDLLDGEVHKSCTHLEFRCSTGHCIPIAAKCNTTNECPDASDEIGCDDYDDSDRMTDQKPDDFGEDPVFQNETRIHENTFDSKPFDNDSTETETTVSNNSDVNSTERSFDIDASDKNHDDPTENNPINNGNVCPDDTMTCDETRCVLLSQRCDNVADCRDGADERNCEQCGYDDFRCSSNNQCISFDRKCNKVIDCPNGEDERDCGCLEGEFRCSDGTCIEQRKRCDGVTHCSDGSDEINCVSSEKKKWSGLHVCQKQGMFRCSDGTCLSVLVRCDGRVDCPADHSDELNCPCSSNQWQCDYGTCIRRSKRCDGQVDCPSDRSDERNCPASATPLSSSFICTSGRAIPASNRCNGVHDCPNGDFSDEDDCDPKFRCKDGTFIQDTRKCDGNYDCPDLSDEKNCPCGIDDFKCDNGICITAKKHCDGTRDCQDGSDERNCRASSNCMFYEYKCSNGDCISVALICNGRKDCRDGSDEKNCPCGWGEFHCDHNSSCIKMSLRCDGHKDCPLGEDERSCGPCPAGKWQCEDGSCINAFERCDLRTDFEDRSDEMKCPDRSVDPSTIKCAARCDDGRCVPDDKVCDGVNDCFDGLDELDCDCSSDEFRCANGDCISASQRCNGYSDCIDDSDEENCQNTAESPSSPVGCRFNEFTCTDGQCINESFLCDGRADCTDLSDEESCPPPTNCRDDEWRCTSGECIDSRRKCDGRHDCSDNSDEHDFECQLTTRRNEEYDTTPYYDSASTRRSWEIPTTRRAWEVPTTRRPWELPSTPNYAPYPTQGPRGYTTPYPNTYPPPSQAPATQRPYIATGGCRSDQWRCENNPCIPRHQRCNGEVDCPFDRSDELDCSPGYNDNRLNLHVYDVRENTQVVKEGQDVVFRCRDEGTRRAAVGWSREGGRPLPEGSTDEDGRLEMFKVKVSDSGSYVCSAKGYSKYEDGAEQTVRLIISPQNRTDVILPPAACRADQATCLNLDCIPRSGLCDGVFDCRDRSDEESCTSGPRGLCEPNQFRCDNKRCVAKTWVCDSDNDCLDNSDEENCAPPPLGSICRSSEFMCSSQQCVPRSFQCDGHNDCNDGSDEIGCAPVYISQPPPRFKFLSPGDTMVLTCMAVGVPTPLVIWRLNWGHIPDKCSYGSENGLGTLTCPDIEAADQGAYSCEALNSQGNSAFATPDTILTVNSTQSHVVCPAGYFNSEANAPQDCIKCFCFGASARCKSADLFTYQLPTPLGEGGTVLLGLVREASGELNEQPITDLYYYQPTFYNGATVTKLVDSSPHDVHPYLTLPESYNGIQLTSYGGYIKYRIRPHVHRTIYSNLPDVVIKGKYATLVHHSQLINNPSSEINLEVRLLPEHWQKTTPTGIVQATREDLMMALDNVERIFLHAEINGGGVNISDFKMDSAQQLDLGMGAANYVEECECPRGYTGLSCQKCEQGFVRESSGAWLGHCREEEQTCPAGYYGEPRRGVPCRPCPCPLTTPTNQFARTCHLGNDGQVACDCQPGYEGSRCERCAPGLVGNPLQPGDSCREPPASRCNPDGTSVESHGSCTCKDYVEGQYCDQCKQTSFYLSPDNQHGCARCFCTGVTDQCGSSNLRRKTISSRFNSPQQRPVKIYAVHGVSTRYNDPKPTDLEPQTYGGELVLRDFDRSSQNTYYWSLPENFNGDKVTSYGGYLTYTIRHQPSPGGQSSRNNAADVQLISLNGLAFNYFGNFVPSNDGYLNGSVQFLEKHWQRSDGKPVQRSDMLMALSDVETILVKATYTTNTEEAALVSVAIEIAEDGGNGPLALHVEQCRCPRGYLGTSCEDCAPGFMRVPDGIYLELCGPCECNGHSSQCHPETGVCFACQHNTDGEKCEECAPGYISDGNNNCVPTGPTEDCRCDARGGSCSYGRCQCKQNVEGDTCNQCRPGTFNLDESNPSGCTPCFCSGVTNSCQAASFLKRLAIPAPVISELHGYTLMTIDADTVINSNFVMNQQLNQLGYIFGTYPPRDPHYWSLPQFPGNRITSYGGNLQITQKFESGDYMESSEPNTNVVLIGGDQSIFWTNPQSFKSKEPLSYQVPLNEGAWLDLATSSPVTRDQFLTVLSELRRVLVLATLSPHVTSTYISDVSMDTAMMTDEGQGGANDVELCSCPEGYSGTSCEQCAPAWYRDERRRCAPCPCNGRADSCQSAPNGQVFCNCKLPYTGRDCASVGLVMELHPTIHDDEPNATAFQRRVTLTCRYRAPEPLSIQFIYDGEKIGPVKNYSESLYDVDGWHGEFVWSTVWDTRQGGTVVECHAITSTGHTLGMLNARLAPGDDSVVSTTLHPPPVSTVTVQITKPLIEIVALGSTVNFTCAARSRVKQTPLSITWSKSGGHLPLDRAVADQRGLLIITDVQVSDSGTYICQASDGISIGRDSVSFVVPPNSNTRPVVQILPPYVDAYEGDLVRLECRATGNPQPTISWVRSSNRAIPYASTLSESVFTIEHARKADEGEYRCVATNALGSVESTAMVFVNRRAGQPLPAQLNIEPSQPNVQEGQNVQIVCSGPTEIPADTIAWSRQDGYGLPSNVRTNYGVLYIERAVYDNNGVYICKSSLITITPVQVSVNVRLPTPTTPNPDDEPGLILPVNATTVPTGGSLTIDCIPQGYPLPIIKWKKYNEEFGRGVSQRGNLLVIANAEQSDGGYYICEATLQDGNPVTQAYLSVMIERREAPKVEIWPTGIVAVTLDSAFELRCRVTAGEPEPVVTWSRPGRQMSVYTHVLPGNILSLTKISVNDEGEYICSASNIAGEASASTTITVQSTPQITITPQNYIQAFAGQPIKVDCRATGYPEPTVFWRKEKDRRELSPPTAGIASIRIPAASVQDEDDYTCIAQSAAGSSQDQIHIVVDSIEEGSGTDPGQIYEPPIRQDPDTFYAAEGTNVDIRCNVTGPDNNIVVKWSRADGYPLQPSNIQNGDTLTLVRATSRDAGLYQCSGVDRRSGGVVFASQTKLAIERTPKITLKPKSQTVRPGQYANVECVVEGDQPMTVTWQAASGELSPRAEIRLPNLRFNRIEVDDAGMYVCLARNRVGLARAEAEVKVFEYVGPSKTVSHDHTQRAQPGSMVQLSCNVTEPDVNIWWSKDNGPLPPRIQQTDGILRFQVQRTDSGRYICHIKDTYGRTTQNHIDLHIDDCYAPNNFHCYDDSGCIPAEYVCDDFPDCKDRSDEDDCRNRGKRLTDHHLWLIQAFEPAKPTGRVWIERPRGPETVGNNVTVNCRASSPDLRLRWERPGLPQYVNSKNSPGLSVLDLPSVTTPDAGLYRCLGENQYQQLVTDEFTLEVQPAPEPPFRPFPLPADKVYTAPLGSNVSLPCTNDLAQPEVEWIREYGHLSKQVNPREPELRLERIQESDAGTYICRVMNGNTALESRVILKVSHVVPKFNRYSWLSLKPPTDVYSKLDIELSVKPQVNDGLILYNSENAGRTGDMVALRLVNGVPEFQYNAGSGVITLQGDRLIELNKWHTVRISRTYQTITMYVDNNGPFTAESPGAKYQGLELKQPMYIGGVPDLTQLPDTLLDSTGLVGCVNMLIVSKEEISLMRDRLEDSGDLSECDSCTPNPCRNSGVCQDARNERGFVCLCAAGFAGHDCARTGEACRPGLCGPGKCHDTDDGYKCSCPIQFSGRRCELQQQIEYPAFTGSAYLAFEPPKGWRIFKLSMKIKAASPVTNGVIMYCSESILGSGGFTSLAVRDGYLEFRFDMGDGNRPTVLRSQRLLAPNDWTDVVVGRLSQQVSMTVNKLDDVKGTLEQSGNKKELRWETPMYVGGYDDQAIVLNNKTEVSGGFNGCIKDLAVYGTRIDMVNSPINSANVKECSNFGPQRGDIPAELTTGATDTQADCQCRNGGTCRLPQLTCDCPPGFAGSQCQYRESSQDPCAAQPCQEGGTCRPTAQGYKCDCRLGFAGYHCQNAIHLQDKVQLNGDGYVELPADLLDHTTPGIPQTIALAVVSKHDGVLLHQRETRSYPGEGDFLLLHIVRGFVVLEWNLGGGIGTVTSNVQINDGQRHLIYLELRAREAILEVNDSRVYGTAPGLSTVLNSDSSIYLGGIPNSENVRGLPGFDGCIEQVEFPELANVHGAVKIGQTAISAVNAQRCSG